MNSYLIKNARIVNEGTILHGDVLVENGIIQQIGSNIFKEGIPLLDAKDKFLIPGLIDDQVHFREPGLTHKANIATNETAVWWNHNFMSNRTLFQQQHKNCFRKSLILRKSLPTSITHLCSEEPMTT